MTENTPYRIFFFVLLIFLRRVRKILALSNLRVMRNVVMRPDQSNDIWVVQGVRFERTNH